MSRRRSWFWVLALAASVVAGLVVAAWLRGPGPVVECDVEPHRLDGVVYEMPNCG